MRAVVVIPTRGNSPWLQETMASVAALGARVESIVVCPAEVANDITLRWPAARVTFDEGRGLYAALNTGFRQLTGEAVVTWLNDDDLLCAEGTAACLRWLETEFTADVVYGGVELIDAQGARQGELPVARRVNDLGGLLSRGIVPLAQPGTWLRLSLVERLGGFDESYRLAGDLDLFCRALATGARFCFVPAKVACFRLRAGQLSKDEATGDREKARALGNWRGTPGSLGTLLRFRRDNARVYFDRIRRHGFVSMRKLYRQD